MIFELGRSLEEEMVTHFSIFGILGNPMDRRTWWAIHHGVTKSQTQLSNRSCTAIIFLY